MGTFIWWIKITLIGTLSVFFLTFAIFNLISAYQLKNPWEFVMTFFSQCLMLMISAVGIIYSTIQLYYFAKKDKAEHEHN